MPDLVDLVVEVRDKNFTRLGTILSDELDLAAQVLYCNVGNWTLNIAAEHPMADSLREPGSGIICYLGGNVLFSGPTNKPEKAQTVDDPGGTITVTGATDEVILAKTVAYPLPSQPDVTQQTVSHDDASGPAETVMKHYVSANVTGRTWPILSVATDQGRGAATSYSARFDYLGDLLTSVSNVTGMGFYVKYDGTGPRFEVYQTRDLTKAVRLSVKNNTLDGQRVSITAPGVTRVIVAGQGDEENRTFIEVSDADSLQAEDDWGMRMERFIDQRQTDDPAELTKGGTDELAKDGFTAIDVQAVPSETSTFTFGEDKDWYLGDLVTVIQDGQELPTQVTGISLKVSSTDGFKLGAVLGNPAGFDNALRNAVKTQGKRLNALERANDWTKKIAELEARIAALGG